MTVPDDVNPFSDEGKAYLQSQGVNYSVGFQALVKYSKMAEEDLKQGELFMRLEGLVEDTINKVSKMDDDRRDKKLLIKIFRRRYEITWIWRRIPERLYSRRSMCAWGHTGESHVMTIVTAI